MATQDPYAQGYTKWQQRYAAMPSDAWAFGAAPTREVEVGAMIYRELHGASPARVLDLGAGDGRNTLFLAAQGFDVLAVDAAVSGLQRLKARLTAQGSGATLVSADLRTFALPSNVDMLVASYVIHMLPAPYSFLKQWQACTRPGGLCIVSTRGRFADDPPDYWFPDTLALKHFFEFSGWEIYHAHEEYQRRPDRLFRRTAVVARKPIE